jgi:excisionase family DNA binding protein
MDCPAAAGCCREAPPSESLTIAETADRLGVSLALAYRETRAGRLPAARVGRSWRVDARRLDALFDRTQP